MPIEPPAISEVAVEDAVKGEVAQVQTGIPDPQQITLALAYFGRQLDAQAADCFVDTYQMAAHPVCSLGIAKVDQLLLFVAQLNQCPPFWSCRRRRPVAQR